MRLFAPQCFISVANSATKFTAKWEQVKSEGNPEPSSCSSALLLAILGCLLRRMTSLCKNERAYRPNHSPPKRWPRNKSSFPDWVSLPNGSLPVLPHLCLPKASPRCIFTPTCADMFWFKETFSTKRQIVMRAPFIFFIAATLSSLKFSGLNLTVLKKHPVAGLFLT